VVENLLGLLARSIHDAGWLTVFFASVICVLLALLVLAALVAIFGRKTEVKEYAYKVFHDLIGIFHDLISLFRPKKDRKQEGQP
jgi:hypothetical protein